MGCLDSTIIVADLRKKFQKWTDPSSIQDPPVTLTPENGPNFIPRLNEVCRRLNREGLWKDATQEVDFNGSPLGYITLPRRCLAVQGAAMNWIYGGIDLYLRAGEYRIGSLGWKSPREYKNPGWTDMGDGYCTQSDIDPEAPATLRLKITDAADAGKKVRFFGRDEDGNEVYSEGKRGVELESASLTADTTQVFSVIDAITAERFSSPWSVWMVVDGEETKLGSYEPGETRPCYRRYKTGIIKDAFKVYARRRTIELVDESDIVMPADDASIEFGLRARALEDAEHQDDADKLWLRAIRELDNQIREARGSIRITLPFREALPRSLPQHVK